MKLGYGLQHFFIPQLELVHVVYIRERYRRSFWLLFLQLR